MSKRVQDICPNTKTSKEHSKFKKKYKKRTNVQLHSKPHQKKKTTKSKLKQDAIFNLSNWQGFSLFLLFNYSTWHCPRVQTHGHSLSCW